MAVRGMDDALSEGLRRSGEGGGEGSVRSLSGQGNVEGERWVLYHSVPLADRKSVV